MFVAIALFAATILVATQPQVRGVQATNQAQVKVEAFVVDGGDAESSKRFERRLQELANDGWQYQGIVTRRSTDVVTIGDGRGSVDTTWIAFQKLR